MVKAWSRKDLGQSWTPPPCTEWKAAGFSTLVTTSARFEHPSGAEGLLRRVGAISELAGMRYWSTTHHQWRTLIPEAWALTGLEAPQRRKDFTAEELRAGKPLYFSQSDNLTGRATWRLLVTEASADRIVYNLENVSAMRYLLITVFQPGETQSICFLERESGDVWRYYSMVRTGRKASPKLAGNEASAMNRAVAFYRSLTGIPTDREPPAAP